MIGLKLNRDRHWTGKEKKKKEGDEKKWVTFGWSPSDLLLCQYNWTIVWLNQSYLIPQDNKYIPIYISQDFFFSIPSYKHHKYSPNGTVIFFFLTLPLFIYPIWSFIFCLFYFFFLFFSFFPHLIFFFFLFCYLQYFFPAFFSISL